MRILWVKAGGLLPIDIGGRIRSYQTLRDLAKRHEVTACTFYPTMNPDPHEEGLRRQNIQPALIPMDIPTGRSLGEAVRFVRMQFHDLPYSIAKYHTPEVRRRVAELFASGKFDVAVCDFLVPAALMPWGGGTPIVLFTHNFETEIWRRQHELARSPVWRTIYGREAAKMARAERDYAERADIILTVSARDTEAFEKLVPGARVRTIPTGVDTEYFQPNPAAPVDAARLVFTGAMDWMPNQDAVLWAAAEILPKLWAVRPDVHFWIVGRRPSAAIEALTRQDSRIHVTGSVPDIRPYLHESAIYVVPMRSGSGTRLKIFEAMASGKAIVSTSVGAEGLPVVSGENIMLTDTPEEFVSAVVRLLNDSSERERLAINARALVEQNYGWPAIGRAFEQCLQEAVTKVTYS